MAAGNGHRPSPDGHTTPPDGFESWDGYMSAFEAHSRHQARADAYDPVLCARLSKAIRLAPNAIVLNALLEGQQVPADALDQAWRKRYRL